MPNFSIYMPIISIIYKQNIFHSSDLPTLHLYMKKSTFQAAITVANSLVSTNLLVLPVIYLQRGVFQNLIGSVIMSGVMCATAYAIGTLVSGKQKLFIKVVKAELGQKWANLMAIFGSISTTLVSCIIFLIASSTTYDLCQNFSQSIQSFGSKGFISILMILFLPLSLLNSLEIVVKFGFVSLSLILIYIATIFYSFLQNLPNIDSGAFERKQISIQNIQFLLAVQGFSFICHPSLDSVLKQNKKSQTNGKAVIGGYIMSFFIMVSCGFLGALALYKKESHNKNNVIGYFINSWQYYVLGVSIIIYLVSIIPILTFVSRIQIYEILPQSFKNRQNCYKYLKLAFALVFSSLNLMFIWAETTPSSVMGFVGTIVCFLICYFLPMYLKIKLIKKAEKLQLKSLTEDKKSLITAEQFLLNDGNNQQGEQLLPTEQKTIRQVYKAGYITILAFGSILMIGQVVSLLINLIR